MKCLRAIDVIPGQTAMHGAPLSGITSRTIASISQAADRWPRKELSSLDGPRTKREAPNRRTVAPVAMLTGWRGVSGRPSRERLAVMRWSRPAACMRLCVGLTGATR